MADLVRGTGGEAPGKFRNSGVKLCQNDSVGYNQHKHIAKSGGDDYIGHPPHVKKWGGYIPPIPPGSSAHDTYSIVVLYM